MKSVDRATRTPRPPELSSVDSPGARGVGMRWIDGKFVEQPRGVIRFPGDRAGEPQVVGRRLGSGPLTEYLGQSPGVDGRLERPLRLEVDNAGQTIDRLEVLARPGQTEGPVIPGGGIGQDRPPPAARTGRPSRAGPGCSWPRMRSSQIARRAGSAASRKRYVCPGRQRQVGRRFEGREGLLGHDRFRVGPQHALPASPGGQRALALEMIPAFVNQGRPWPILRGCRHHTESLEDADRRPQSIRADRADLHVVIIPEPAETPRAHDARA